MLKTNMNMIDRILRSVIGIGLVYYGFFENSWIGNEIITLLLGVMGVANFSFSISGFCPLYKLAGLNFAK